MNSNKTKKIDVSIQKIKTNILIGSAKLLAKLPLFFQLKFGHFLGFLTWVIPNKRKKIAARNIALCFPNMPLKEQEELLKKNLLSTGTGFAEMIVAYWGKQDKFFDRFEFSGLEYVEQALLKNKGCILLSCHLHSIELAVRAINCQLKNTLNSKAHMLARQHNNKIFEAHIDLARRKYCEKTIDKKDVKSVLRSLKKNHPVYYIPDQNFSYQCEYIDFFKLPAATVIAPVRLAQVSQSPVVSWFAFRHKNKKGQICWKIHFNKPLDYFQTDDIQSSLSKMNQLFETEIRKNPEQYLWVHRRFKNHPKGKNHLYQNL